MSDTPTPVLVTVPVKSPWASKTLWVNGLTIAGALLVFLIDTMNAGELPFTLDAKWIAFILGLLNFGLRWITTAPVEGGPGT